MTERLYYADAYLRSFEARVVDRLEVNGQPAIILDRTAFYPEGGGQPSDRGMLNRVAVVDVQTRETDDEVLHILSAPLPEETVTGAVDAARRFDLMQQHTGQHILSQAFIHTANAETVSFHLNPDPDEGALTIDLNKAALTSAEVDRAEDFANSIVYENRPVVARFVNDEELQSLPLRKPPKVDKAIRIVEIQGFDWSACGGTHVSRTGEVGLIKIVKAEKRGTETRIEFRCGRRALIDYRRKHQLISQAASDLTIGFWELDQAIGRLQAEAKAARKQLTGRRRAPAAVRSARSAQRDRTARRLRIDHADVVAARCRLSQAHGESVSGATQDRGALGRHRAISVVGLCALQRSVDRSGNAVESSGGAAGR